MKELIFAAVFFLCISAGSAQEKRLLVKGEPGKDNPEYVYGKVKEIHNQAFHITDENGKIVKGKPFTFAEAQNVELRQPLSYYYNQLGHLIKMSAIDDNGNKWIVVVHNVNNRIENLYWLKNDTLISMADYVYLNNGNIEVQGKNIQTNVLGGKTVYQFDSKGFLVRRTSYNNTGSVSFDMEFTRNSDGTLKSYKGLNREGKIQYFYDNNTYNDHGLQESYFMKILGGEEVNRQGEKIEYEYDDHGNWIKRISRGWMMIERKIVYYE
jgi:hypothetical protein